MNKYEDVGFLNSKATATSIKNPGLAQPTAFRPTGPATNRAARYPAACPKPVERGEQGMLPAHQGARP